MKIIEMPENKKIVELDCGKYPDVIGTSLKLTGTEKDVFATALKIATDVNGHQDTPELRKQIRLYIRQNQLY